MPPMSAASKELGHIPTKDERQLETQLGESSLDGAKVEIDETKAPNVPRP